MAPYKKLKHFRISVRKEHDPKSTPQLSERQREVLMIYGQSIVSGNKRKHDHYIALTLDVDTETVRWHLKKARAKLGVATTKAAYRKAVQLDLLEV